MNKIQDALERALSVEHEEEYMTEKAEKILIDAGIMDRDDPEILEDSFYDRPALWFALRVVRMALDNV